MQADFQRAMKNTLTYEGGWSNHPRDPGGVTLEGVIQRVYDAYRRRKGKPIRSLVPSMRGTPEWNTERDEIYREQYWNAVRGDEIPAGIDLVVFDGAVNSGPRQSILWLQRSLNACKSQNSPSINVDGTIGETTLDALERNLDNDRLVADICGRRLAFLQALSTWDAFGKGWSRRVSHVKAEGMAMATGAEAKPIIAPADQDMSGEAEGIGDAKATTAELKQPPVSVEVGTGATTGAGGGASVIQPLQDASTQLQPFSYSIKIIQYVLIAITLVCLGLTIYALWRNYKNKKVETADAFAPVPENA